MSRHTRSNRCVPVLDWPQGDQAAWRRALLPADPFDSTVGLADRWRPATQRMIAASYGRWLGWLAFTDTLYAEVRPGARASRAQVKAYRDALRAADLADFTVARLIGHLGDALSVLDPAGDWSWIKLAGSRLHARAVPKRDIRSIMQPPQAILRLGYDLMDAAETQRFTTASVRAVLFRDGLLLNFLTLRPLRMANLKCLALGETLEFRDAWWVRFPAEATKGGEVIDFPWPEQLCAPLERYLDTHRQVLLKGARKGPPSSALWVSKQGKQMCASALSFQIKGRTEEEFGKAINPHTFRHIAATTIAAVDPTESAAIALLLGHKSMAPSEKHYNRARMLGAGERHQATIARLRGGAG